MDYRDNRQRWAESHQVVHFYAGQWCTFTPALTLSLISLSATRATARLIPIASTSSSAGMAELFTFTRLSKSQWKSARTTNAIERLNEEFKRRIKTQTVLPCPETVPMLLWALLASGQIQMRKVDGWETLDQLIADETLDRAA